MSLPSLLLIMLLLCFSMCVRTARRLLAVDGASNVQSNISEKVTENVKKHSAVTKKEAVKSIEGGAMTQRSKPTKAVDAKKKDLPGLGQAGSDELAKFCHMDLLNAIILKVSRRSALSVNGAGNVKEDVYTEDYAEPHQTPPIHNRET